MDKQALKSIFDEFKDKEFRPGQVEALDFISESGKEVLVICAPTGSGKSLINMVAGASKGRFAYLCSSKQLQRQLQHEFPEAKLMMGRNNFPCEMFASQFPHVTAADCIGKANCLDKESCQYDIHKKEVLSHPYQIINYSYFIHEANFIGRFSDYDRIICDEGDVVEKILADFVNISIPSRVIHKFDLKEPERKTATAKDSMEIWKAWADSVVQKFVDHRLLLGRQIVCLTTGTEEHFKAIKQMAYYNNMITKLTFFVDKVDDSWIFEIKKTKTGSRSFEFKPLWLIPEFTKDNFFKHAKQVVFTSATFPAIRVFAHMMGLEVDDVDYKEVDTVFPVENRRVLLEFAGDLAYRKWSDNISGVLKRVVELINGHRGQKGIIHTVSWKLNNLIMELNREVGRRLITHDSKNKEEVLNEFMETPHGDLVFVSPSSTRGLDLPYDLCRFNIVAKAPYLSMADKMVSQRIHGSGIGRLWYKSSAAQEIVQACGRGVRHSDDTCISYILDNQACNLIVDNQALFPRYFLDAIEVS